jgi:hypothetical protein
MDAARTDQRARAQAFVERRWRVFPVEYQDKRPIKTGGLKPDGTPKRMKWGTATASEPTPQMLDLWFGDEPVNIGIAAKNSRLVMLDEDRLGGLVALCEAYGQPVPITYRVRTKDGWHYYFDAPQHIEIGNSTHLKEEYGIDVRGGRGDGGYVVAAGSVHESGWVYEAEDEDADTIELPWWLVELLLPDPEPDFVTVLNAEPRTDRRYTPDEADRWIERYGIHPLRSSTEGGRNNTLNTAAMVLGHFVPHHISEPEARAGLTAIAREIGLRVDEIGATISSGLKAGMKDPYTVSEPPEVDEDEESAEDVSALRRARLIAEQLEKLEISAEAKRLFNAKHQPRASAPEPMSLSELLALPDEPIRYRVDGLLGVGGRILLAAAQKAGKTTLMGNLIRCLVDGGEFLGRHLVEPVDGRVILLDTELPQRTLKDWLGRQSIRNEDGVTVLSLRDRVTSFDLTEPAALARWAELLQPLDPAFVILDCLRPVLDACGLDEKTESGRFLVPFGELLGRIGVEEACIVQHMGHNGERARGDSGLLGWPDANWKIVRKDAEEDRSTRYFSAFGRDVDVPECELGFNSMTGELKAIGGNRKDADARAAIPVILEVLTEKPKLSMRRIEEELAESDLTRAAIRAALKLGVIERRILVEEGPKRSRLHSVLR